MNGDTERFRNLLKVMNERNVRDQAAWLRIHVLISLSILIVILIVNCTSKPYFHDWNICHIILGNSFESPGVSF